MDALSFIIEISKIVGSSGIVVFFMNRRAKKSDRITIRENKTAADRVVANVGDKVESLHKGINGRMNELLQVTNKASRLKGHQEGMAEAAGEISDSVISVYVIDDDSDDLFFVQQAFDKEEKITYVLSTNLEIFKENLPIDPNVYVIDNKFIGSGERGIDILRLIIKKNKNNFSIAYTASDDEKTRNEYDDAGVDRFVYKNNNSEKSLKTLVQYVLEGVELVAARKQ